MERDTPNPASPSDPPQDQPATAAPSNVGGLLYAVTTLLGYGRHLLDTVRHRATAASFATLASGFGTANLATILAHLNRGILRAIALERMLLARAATGRDIDFVERRTRTDAPQPTPAAPQTDQPAAPAATPKAKPRRSRPPGGDDPELFMPTLEELERQVRRRTVSRTMAEICLDLGVLPAFCTAAFWNGLFETMLYFGGNGVVAMARETTRRKQAFFQEQDRKPGSTWEWVNQTRDAIRKAIGFFIGEPPVDPFAQSPTQCTEALATGPP